MENDIYQKQMFPYHASNSPYLRRLDNRDESLLRMFIHWADDQTKWSKETASTRIVDGGQKNQTINFTKSTNGTSVDITYYNSHDPIQGQHHKDEGSRNHSTSSLGDAHLSRPGTPQPPTKTNSGTQPSTDRDRYRIMYLLVKVEQQQEQVRQVIENMGKKETPIEEVQNMVNVQAAISKMHGHLIGVRDNDQVMMKQIGFGADMDEFLRSIEQGCSMIEDLPVPDTNEEKIRLVHHMEQYGNKQETQNEPFKLRRRKNTSPPSLDKMHDNNIRASKRSDGPATLKEDKNKPGKLTEKSQDLMGQKTAKDNQTKKTCNLPLIGGGQSQEESDVASLMKEIDDLMDDTGLMKGRHNHLLSYESIMLGAGENSDQIKLGDKQASKQPDHFIDELDKLLDECDAE